MKEDAILVSTLCARLERAIHCDVGMQGLRTLLSGWIAKHGDITHETLRQRSQRDGEAWLAPYEAKLFSIYAGYDLTKD